MNSHPVIKSLLKRTIPLFVGVQIAMISAASASAAPLTKEAESIRAAFAKIGATACARSMASTVMFLADNRPTLTNRTWSNSAPNHKPIISDFVIQGTKSDYSRTGTVTLAPFGDRCVGSYTMVTLIEGKDCASAMLDSGFTPPKWKIEESIENGDGGKVRLVSRPDNSDLEFFFNDLPKGCQLIKREFLDLGIGD